MSANIPTVGNPRQLDRKSEPEEQITEKQAEEPARVARLLMAILRDVALLKRRWWPQRVDFEDRTVDATGTTLYRFPHDFGGRVRWWVVEWNGTIAASLARHASTDDKTLVLVSYTAGTATVRIEEAG